MLVTVGKERIGVPTRIGVVKAEMSAQELDVKFGHVCGIGPYSSLPPPLRSPAPPLLQ